LVSPADSFFLERFISLSTYFLAPLLVTYIVSCHYLFAVAIYMLICTKLGGRRALVLPSSALVLSSQSGFSIYFHPRV